LLCQFKTKLLELALLSTSSSSLLKITSSTSSFCNTTKKNPKERNTTLQQHQHPRLNRPSENKSAENKQKNLTKERAIGERTKLKKQTWGDYYMALITQEPLEKSKADGDATVPAHLQTRRIL
jgi:hypothetical protein